jgi:hypothetical protein
LGLCLEAVGTIGVTWRECALLGKPLSITEWPALEPGLGVPVVREPGMERSGKAEGKESPLWIFWITGMGSVGPGS